MSRQHCGKVEELETEIRSAVNEAEDVVELKIYEIKVQSPRKAKEALCITLSPLVKKIDAVKREVMGGNFDTNKVLGFGDTTNKDLQLRDTLLVHSPRQLENVVVGLEDDLMKIKRRLTGPPSTREAVPILGMGGIGKTTLAKKSYDDPEIRHRFDIRIWVTISQDYRITDLLLGVLSCTSSVVKDKTDDDQLMDMIYKTLKGRRYLVVMDDIWSTDLWDLMTRTFPDDNNGSRIILTSRLKDLTMHADPDNTPHEINLLNLDESWKLLHEKVFGIQQVCPPELKDIGKKVAQKCQGLPLALLVVAGYLSKVARTQESWEAVAKNVSKVVANEPDKCLGVLAMSYNYLPNHLKPCFLYMGVFPEDREVSVERLINLWVSEGFLGKERLKSLEEVGRDSLKDLFSRNLIMVRSKRLNGEVRTCGVHDLVRDLILGVAEKEKFLQVTTDPSAEKLCVRRHSSHLGTYQADIWESPSSYLTRTLHFFSVIEAPSIRAVRLKLLRVLAIDSYCEIPGFPLEITKLVHLRYLEFWCEYNIHSSVSELYSLQTFIIKCPGTKPQIMPETIWRMKQLRHLYIGDSVSFPIPSNKQLRNLGNSHLCLHKVRLRTSHPLGWGPSPDPSRTRDALCTGLPFKQLRNLKGLSCLSFTSCTSEFFSAVPNLKRLKLRGSCKAQKMFQHLNVLSCLKELENLKLWCEGICIPCIPSKYILPTSLKRLNLRCTYLPWEDMANIIVLTNLEVLKIKDNGFVGDIWRLNDDEIFTQLKFLLIDGQVWNAGKLAVLTSQSFNAQF